MMHEIQQFSPVLPDRWQRLKAGVLALTGVDINDDKGIAEGTAGSLWAKISYEYDPIAHELTLQTLDKTFYLSEAVLDQEIHKFVESTR
jgi:hypothetical protein